MKVLVDRDECMGCGMCALLAPAAFTQDDDGTVLLLVDEVPEAERASVEDAVMNCPAGALAIEAPSD